MPYDILNLQLGFSTYYLVVDLVAISNKSIRGMVNLLPSFPVGQIKIAV